MGHITEVCIKKRKQESANMSETKEEKYKEKDGDDKRDRRGSSHPAGAWNVSCVRHPNLVTVTYLKDE